MLFHEVSQGSDEWHKIRIGLATSSCFSDIITPSKGEPSKSMDPYSNKLIGELMTGENSEDFQSYWMERGTKFEADAAASYEVITGNTLDRGGFITDDEMMIGASPDRRVLKMGTVVGGLEIKCPSQAIHVGNLLRMIKHGAIDPQYKPQVQGQILIGGFEFVDWFSYHPDMPPALVRTYRDDTFCNQLETALDMFLDMLNEKINLLSNHMIIPPRPILNFYEHQKANADNLNSNILYAG